MTAELTTIKVAYEDESMSPAEIAEDRGLELSAVKSALMQCSAKYRRDCGSEPEEVDELNFSKEEQLQVKRMMMDIALGADDEHLRAKMCINIRDDAKGRKDAVKQMQGNNFNILYINEQLKKVRELTAGVKQKVINV